MSLISALQRLVKSEDKKESSAPAIDVSKEAVVLEAKTEAREVIIEAKDQALKIKTRAQEEARKIKEESIDLDKKVAVRKAQLEAKERELSEKIKGLKSAKHSLDREKEKIIEAKKKNQEEFERISSLSREEARNLLLAGLEKELREEKGKKIKEAEDEIRKETETLSREILLDALKFGATDYVVEYSTSKVKLEDAELKGRIIGKEGRNIRKFEELTGVDLDLDASPGEIMISCFDPIRREIAKNALEKLIADGRIQPARIEEIIGKTGVEIQNIMYKEGDDLCHKVGAYGLSKELVQELGKFKYRFSYGQNMIEHTLEVTRIGMALARELGAKLDTVRLGCLLHDIGKIVTDAEGSHIDLGVKLLKKSGISEEVLACVAEHHTDNQSSLESAIVALADHISGARPGSRGEDYEAYVKRLKDLEEVALSFDGVEKAYAISAGREVRVFVDPKEVDDYATALLAREIAKKIELEQTYPGTVKVMVIRETRITETAK